MVNPCYILVSIEIIINKKRLHIDLYLMRCHGEDTNINWKWNEAQYLGFRQQTISSIANTAQCFVKWKVLTSLLFISCLKMTHEEC